MNSNPGITRHLSSLLDVDAAELCVEPLPGGISNRSFLLSGRREKWVVRLPFGTDEQYLQTLDPVSEESLLAVVSEAGLTPDVLVYDPGTRSLITRYLENATQWTPEMARLPGNIDRIAQTLRRLHGLKTTPKIKEFRPSAVLEIYLKAAGRSSGSMGSEGFSREEQGWRRELQQLSRDFERRFPARGLCHNDLVAANILDDGQVWLVDFEYALRAHPILDLAGVAGMNDYDASQRSLLVAAYYGTDPVPFRSQQLDEVIRLVQLLSYFWARSRWEYSAGSEEVTRFADTMAAMLR